MFSRFSPLLHVQLSAERIVIEEASGARLVDEVPDLAISRGPDVRVMAVGAQARDAAVRAGGRCVNPFAHPRTLMSDFTLAEVVLRYFVRRALGNGWLTPSPRILLHPLGDPEGGFTQVEWRAFRELALGAGASKAYLWSGRPVSVVERNTAEFLKRCEGAD